MARETVIIFTGTEYLEIGIDYFYQDPEIQDLDKEQVKQFYGVTRVALTSMKDLNKMAQDKDNVVIEGTERFTPEFINKLEKGLGILEVMVKDMWGDTVGESIINKSIRDLLNDSY